MSRVFGVFHGEEAKKSLAIHAGVPDSSGGWNVTGLAWLHCDDMRQARPVSKRGGISTALLKVAVLSVGGKKVRSSGAHQK